MGNCQSDPSKDELPPGEDRPRQGPSSSSSSDPRTALREPPAGNRASVETKLKLDLKRVSGNENPLALPKGAVTQRDPSGRRKKVPPATARAPRSSGGNTARGSKTARGPATAHSALPAAPSAAAAAAPPPPPAPPPRQEVLPSNSCHRPDSHTANPDPQQILSKS